MQKIHLIGNLGKDPEERVTQSGTKISTFSIAVSDIKKETVWYQCMIRGPKLEIFKNILPYLKKGSKVYVVGNFHTPTTYSRKDNSLGISLAVDVDSINFCSSASEEKSTNFEKNTESVFVQEELPF